MRRFAQHCRTLSDDAVRGKFAAAGAEPSVGTFEEFAADFDGEQIRWSSLVKSLGLKAQ